MKREEGIIISLTILWIDVSNLCLGTFKIYAHAYMNLLQLNFYYSTLIDPKIVMD